MKTHEEAFAGELPLVYTQRAIKDIQALDPMIKERIGKTLLRYVKDH